MKTIYDRTRMLVGEEGIKRLQKRSVVVFGIGGVGGFTAEALARAGVGRIGLVDYDVVDITNINRQIIALHSTVGRRKTEVMAERISDINPQIRVDVFSVRLSEDNVNEFPFCEYDYIVDAIDDVKGKLLLAKQAVNCDIPIICSMGTGNKLDPTRFQIAPIEKTHTCPLAKVMRKELKKQGLKGIMTVFSDELPRNGGAEGGRVIPASISFVPATAGLLLASKVITDFIEKEES